MKKFYQDKRMRIVAALVAATILYISGFRFLLLPLIIAIGSFYLPMPSVAKTLFARLFFSTVTVMSVVIVIGAVQSLVLPGTKFTITALILACLIGLLLYMRPPVRPIFFDKADTLPLGLVLITALPILALFIGGHPEKLLLFAGSQVVDAGNHFAAITTSLHSQMLSLREYPAGFYFGMGFFYHTFISDMSDIGWGGNLVSYTMQYIVMSALFVLAAYYLAIGFFGAYSKRGRRYKKLTSYGLLVAVVMPSLILFYQLFFVAQGFLNYLYVVGVMLVSLLYLMSVNDSTRMSRHLGILLFLVLNFAVAASWSPLLPLILGITVLYSVPSGFRWNSLRCLFVYKNIPIMFLGLLYCALFYSQLVSIDLTGEGGMFEAGNLHDFHYLLLATITAGVGYFTYRGMRNKELERVVVAVYGVSLLYVICFVLVHYFRLGEVRYYPIKIAFLLEIIGLIVLGAVLTAEYAESVARTWSKTVLLPVGVFSIVLFSLMTMSSPLSSIRELFKPHSGIPVPEYAWTDAQKIVELGTRGVLHNNNVMILHYNQHAGRIEGYPQMVYRANLMGRELTNWEADSKKCQHVVLDKLESPDASNNEDIGKAVAECVSFLAKHGVSYYIVTDESSATTVRSLLGGQGAHIVTA